MEIVARSLPMVTIALLAGCAAPHVTPAMPTVTVTVTAAPPTPAVEPAACSDDDLEVTNGPMASANTQRRVLVSIRNSSAHACTMVGYPGVALVTPAGGVLIDVPRRPADAAPRLTVQPGEAGTADVLTYAIDTETGNSCARWGRLVVTPPDGYVAHPLPVDLPICGASVSPVG